MVAAKSRSTSPDGLVSIPSIILFIAALFSFRNGASASGRFCPVAYQTVVAAIGRATVVSESSERKTANMLPSFSRRKANDHTTCRPIEDITFRTFLVLKEVVPDLVARPACADGYC